MSTTDNQHPLAGLSAFGAYLHTLRAAEGLALTDVRRRLRGLGVTVRLCDLEDWEAGVRRPGIRAKAALMVALEASSSQADNLILYDLHATADTSRALIAGDRPRLRELVAEHQAYGTTQAQAWVQRRGLWRPAGEPSAIPLWLLEEMSEALGWLYVRDPKLVIRLLREALRWLEREEPSHDG